MDLNLNMRYPNNGKKYTTKLVRINLDKEMEHDIATGRGFMINEPNQALNKTIKETDSIYSNRFFKSLQDPDSFNEFTDRYSCRCKRTQGRDYKDSICPHCHTKVQYVGDDLQITGWINLAPYHVIHPNLYQSLARYIGISTLEAILFPEIEFDENGNPVSQTDKRLAKKKTKSTRRRVKIDETYASIGMIGFYEKFDEIMEYFLGKNKLKKADLYADIMANRKNIFIQNIPVYSSALRPWKLDGGRLTFESTNAIYTMLAKQGAKAKDDSLSIYRNPKYKNSVLWDIQDRYNALYVEIIKILKSKTGQIRSLVGGRCGFTSRAVIVPDPKLRIDYVKLPYFSLLELLQQTIINILVKTYNIVEADAYMRFTRARVTIDKQIWAIMENLINTVGIHILLNRNPTINYGSIMAMNVIGINESYTISMPLQVLASFGADFDGDTLNAIYIPLKEYWEKAMSVFNPRDAMIISRNDGKFNNGVNIFKDILINTNGLINLGRKSYSQNQLDKIHMILDNRK